MKSLLILIALIATSLAQADGWKAWRDCIPNSIGPGGCDSIGPGGGKSIGPGGGLSIGPGGGLSIGPSGGQSIGPGGGQSIGPGGGQSITRDRSRGLDTDTMRSYPQHGLIHHPLLVSPDGSRPDVGPDPAPTYVAPYEEPEAFRPPDSSEDMQPYSAAIAPAPLHINYANFDFAIRSVQAAYNYTDAVKAFKEASVEGDRLVLLKKEYLVNKVKFESAERGSPSPDLTLMQSLDAEVAQDQEIIEIHRKLGEARRLLRKIQVSTDN